MKKILAFALAVMMVILCCACGGDTGKDVSSKPTGNNDSTVSSNDSITSSDEEVSSESSKKEDTTNKNGSVVVGDTAYESFIIDEDSNVKFEGATKGGISSLDTPWNATGLKKTGYYDAEAKTVRESIMNTPNTMDIYGDKITGKVYYVSPDGDDNNDGLSPKTAIKTLDADKFLMNDFQPGDAVLFERGGIWRVTNKLKTKKGVVYGSYGEGPKPAFYASPYNYADEYFWSPSNRANIWKVTVADSDIGLVVFNHGEAVGVKKLNGLVAIEKNFDFYFNVNEDTLYIYYDGGNPGKVFKDIEIGLNMPIIDVSNQENVTIDNLSIKYSGRFGIDLCGCDGSTITNCELGFIGGALQTGSTRLGNAIQTWNGVTNQVISNNWIYQIYDTGITWQGDNKYKTFHMGDTYENITFEKNLIEFCTMSFEFWHGNAEYDASGKTTYTHDYETRAKVINFQIINNISRLPGWGWGAQRPDLVGAHIMCYKHIFPNAVGNKISGNVFDSAYSFLVTWEMPSKAVENKRNGEWDISGNTWYQQASKFNDGIRYNNSFNKASNQKELETVVAGFDTAPKAVKWF